jgi:GNAT superfamily N-acetyltransferase
LSGAAVPSEELQFREGRSRDLRETFDLFERALAGAAQSLGILPPGTSPDPPELEERWRRSRSLIEFLAAQEGCYWVCEDAGAIVGYARMVRFDGMDQLTEVMVEPPHQGRGIGRGLLQRCWPDPPTLELGRIVVAAGTLVDLSLYTEFGTMPITGHWHMRHRTDGYLERRAHETDADATEPGVHVLKDDGAVAEWKRLEPPAIGHDRPLLHEFFGRERTCLATLEDGEATGLCWVSAEGEIGPGVGVNAEALVPVVLAALDRVAKIKEPEHLSIFCTTESWWLLRRLRELGFRVFWPSWIMCSVPLPGLDRYLPTRPSYIL